MQEREDAGKEARTRLGLTQLSQLALPPASRGNTRVKHRLGNVPPREAGQSALKSRELHEVGY